MKNKERIKNLMDEEQIFQELNLNLNYAEFSLSGLINFLYGGECEKIQLDLLGCV